MLTQKLQQNAVKSTQKGTQTFKLGNPTTTMTPTMTQTLHPNSNANQYSNSQEQNESKQDSARLTIELLTTAINSNQRAKQSL